MVTSVGPVPPRGGGRRHKRHLPVSTVFGILFLASLLLTSGTLFLSSKHSTSEWLNCLSNVDAHSCLDDRQMASILELPATFSVTSGHQRILTKSTTEQRRIALENTTSVNDSAINTTNHSLINPLALDEFDYNQSQPKSNVCLTDECITREASKLARAFPMRTKEEWSWCHNHQNLDLTNYPYNGMILIKVPKSSSTSSAAILLRLNYYWNCTIPWKRLQFEHVYANSYTNTYHPNATFLYTTIRHPASRAISRIWFSKVSTRMAILKGNRPDTNETALLSDITTDDKIIHYLRHDDSYHYGSTSRGQGGLQLAYTVLDPPGKGIAPYSFYYENKPFDPEQAVQVRNPHGLLAYVQSVIDDYHFIMVTERFDESVVAMGLLMGLTEDQMGDILVTSGRVSEFQYYQRKCKQMYKSPRNLSPAVRAFLDGDEYRAANYGDLLLHEASNQSLDLTIDQTIGRDRFDRALAKYRHLKQLAAERCRAETVQVCTDQGVLQKEEAVENCYFFKDLGCGYKCIDQMLLELKSENVTQDLFPQVES